MAVIGAIQQRRVTELGKAVGRPWTALDRAVAYMQQTTETMRAFHERFDVVLTPTLSKPPYRQAILLPPRQPA